jgi:hypothetical protein
MDMEQVRLLCAAGEEDIAMGGNVFPYCTDGEILGAILSGDGDCFQAVITRLAIGRVAFNNLFRVFKRTKMSQALRIRFYESFVVGTLHGFQAWVFSKAVIRKVNGDRKSVV